MGTPIYMSPEQVKADKTIDHRSDIYSMGVAMYYAINGRPPYQADKESQFEIFNKIVFEPLPDFQVTSPYSEHVYKACQKDREQRYQRCGDWLEQLSGQTKSKPSISNGEETRYDSDKTTIVPPETPIAATEEIKISATQKNHPSKGMKVLYTASRMLVMSIFLTNSAFFLRQLFLEYELGYVTFSSFLFVGGLDVKAATVIGIDGFLFNNFGLFMSIIVILFEFSFSNNGNTPLLTKFIYGFSFTVLFFVISQRFFMDSLFSTLNFIWLSYYLFISIAYIIQIRNNWSKPEKA
jgi:hypothetical protein